MQGIVAHVSLQEKVSLQTTPVPNRVGVLAFFPYEVPVQGEGRQGNVLVVYDWVRA